MVGISNSNWAGHLNGPFFIDSMVAGSRPNKITQFQLKYHKIIKNEIRNQTASFNKIIHSDV